MVKFNYVFGLAIIIVVVLLSGCVNSYEQPQQRSVENQRSSMNSTEFIKAMASEDLTTMQKENLYVNKVFSWTGTVSDVNQDSVYIVYEFCFVRPDATVIGSPPKTFCYPHNVHLIVDEDQKQKLISLNKGSIISFEGMIKKESNIRPSLDTLTMYNGKIIN